MDSLVSPLLGGALPARRTSGIEDAASMARSSAAQPGSVEAVAADFERMALNELLSMAMTGTDVSDTPFGGGAGERMMQPFLIDQYASSFAAQGGIGIADQVRRELLRLQEASAPGLQGPGQPGV
jgi:peptidoglycan hydrolase FlgJ